MEIEIEKKTESEKKIDGERNKDRERRTMYRISEEKDVEMEIKIYFCMVLLVKI